MPLKTAPVHPRAQKSQKTLPKQRPQLVLADKPQRNRTQTGLTSGSASSQAGQGSQLPDPATEKPAEGLALRSQRRSQFRLRSQLPLRIASAAGGRPRKPAAAEAASAKDQATAVDVHVLGAGGPAPGDESPAKGIGAGGSARGAEVVAEVVEDDKSDCELLPSGGAWQKNTRQTPPLQRDQRGFRNKDPSPPTSPQPPACQRGGSEETSRLESQPAPFSLKRGPLPTTISSDADARGAQRQACTSIERSAVPNQSGSRAAGIVVKAACSAPAGTSSCLATAWTAFKDLVAQVGVQVLGQEQPETSPKHAPDVEERPSASAALAVAFQYVDCLCEEECARGGGKPEPDPHLTTAMFMAAASLLEYGAGEHGSNLRNTLMNKETLAARLKQDAAFAEQYVRQNAPEVASTDLRKLEVAKQHGVWLSGGLYQAKLRRELVAVNNSVGGCITALRARAIRLAGSSTHARRALQNALMEKPHIAEQAGRAPAAQQVDPETLTRLLEQCGAPPEGPPGRSQLHVQGRDLVLQVASASSAAVAAAPLAGVVRVVIAAARAREGGRQQRAFEAELTKLQAELEANVSLMHDSASAAKKAEVSLRVGEGQLADLRKLFDSVPDKHLYDDAVQNLIAKMRQNARERRIMLYSQLGAMKMELQALHGVVRVLTTAARARQGGQPQRALETDLTKLQAELEANVILINDSEYASRDAEASLRVGEGQLADLRKLFDSVSDKRLYDEVVQSLVAEMRKDAEERRIIMNSQLGAIKMELQALRAARAPWAVLAAAFGESDAQFGAETEAAERAATDAPEAAEPPAALPDAPGRPAAAPASKSPSQALVEQLTGGTEASASLGLMLQGGLRRVGRRSRDAQA